MTDRHTVDTITSDALSALYEQLEAAQETELARQLATCDKAFASATVRAARAEQRAKQAESAIERVRTLADRWDNALAPDQRYARTLRAALDQPKQPGCEHCGASASHLPTTYMKGGTVGYCHGELTTEQQPTTTEADQ
jgi:hypothetical protein